MHLYRLAASACSSGCCAMLAGLQKATVRRCPIWLGVGGHVPSVRCRGVTSGLTWSEVDGASVQHSGRWHR